MRTVLLYNAQAANGQCRERAEKLAEGLASWGPELMEISSVKDYARFFRQLGGDRLMIVGGDGTLNRFINDTEGLERPEIWYYAAGTGNDFWHDLGLGDDSEPVKINPYIEDLPTVEVNGRTCRFLNGVGYGIDGYCCEEGDRLKARSDKPVNYTSIAIKGLLFHFKPRTARVITDGVSRTFRGAWLAPTMKGRYYGGGMMPTPGQDRKDPSGRVSTMVMYGRGKLRTLAVFPSIFKGEHVKHRDMTAIIPGSTVTVKFDTPCALQIDGETVLNVSEYTVRTK
ncbi:MAG: diacylglycerol kinase family protein [Oscillospiraceae bacterium]|nr:diacylglycerol kinase family protein [Oscillospiraceae bacterium]